MNLTPMQVSAGEDARPLASGIAEAIARRIVTGVLEPGSALRQEHIAAEFGTSHVPVREAFRQLEAEGLVILLPRRGVRVAASIQTRRAKSPRCGRPMSALRSKMPQAA